jgi:hypothetical protein
MRRRIRRTRKAIANPHIISGLRKRLGTPLSQQHLYAVIGLMRISETREEFKRMLDKAYPKRGDTLQMDLFADQS